jgi:hypothetical protein
MSAENFDGQQAPEEGEPLTDGQDDRGAREYESRWGDLPGWLDELSVENRQRVVRVAVRVGMRLTDTDWHLLEDQHRPDLPRFQRRPPGFRSSR